MDPLLQKKFETEPWKQTSLKVMEFIDIIKNQLNNDQNKEKTDELMNSLMDINESLGVSFVF